MNRLRKRNAKRIVALLLLTGILSWMLPPTVRASAALRYLSPEWIVEHLDGAEVSEGRPDEAPLIIRQLVEPLRKQVSEAGKDSDGPTHDLEDVLLFREVLLDGMVSVLTLSGVQAQRAVTQIDRPDSARWVLRHDRGHVDTGRPLFFAVDQASAPLCARQLLRTLSQSSPLGP